MLAPLPIAAADVEMALSASSASANNSTCVHVPHSQTVGDHVVALSTGALATVLIVRQVKALKASRSKRELSGAAKGSDDIYRLGTHISCWRRQSNDWPNRASRVDQIDSRTNADARAKRDRPDPRTGADGCRFCSDTVCWHIGSIY